MRVIVIGSGMGGAATAYHLAVRGADVVVVDAELPGVATDAGAGIVSPWTSRWDDAVYPLAAAAGRYYPQLAAELRELGHEPSYEVVGGLVVSADERELAAEQERIAARIADAPEAGTSQRLDPAQVRELFPPLAPDLAAVHLTGAGRVDGRVLRRALISAAIDRGVQFIQAGASLQPGLRVRAGADELDGDAVVLAAGAWSADVAEPLGVPVPVAPQRGQISHFDLPGTDTAAWPVVLPQSGHYLLAFPGGRVVAGATRETGSGFDHRVTVAGQREILDEALAVAPGLADASLAETRVGFRPATPDTLPLLGQVASGLFLATGFGPAGLTLAPYAGKLVADLVLGEDVPADLLAPCAPARFA
ncbi:NAD(P)/FAD-dependent oxidoreductase [Amycolatopsis panacis]|uniref:FAD-dependent oxidoreductase n=1 Tax=Amycolatopsis panacis TaxID=2340917 RepID=A0A419HZU7_9PSEU|nr:FAD-dependent oxidoreductase [Amycolatopsis panacis]RJQ82740.1 FAD-dependent oxidoreductase [Amycolatopsis panacis]